MPSASQKRALRLHSLPGVETDSFTFVTAAPFPTLSPANSPKSGSKRKLEDADEVAIPQRKTFRTYAEHKKHETHYYLDGNILLQLGKTRFKVHRSRLASESTWFQMLVDHYNGSTAEDVTVDQDVEDVVNEADNVGDDPLFFLDAAEGEEVPTAEEFAALLTAIYSGINYVFAPPSIDDIRLLYGVSWYYSFGKYHNFAHKFLQSFFPAFDKVTKESSLHHAVQAICMAEKHDIGEILPRALHDLARSSTAALEDCLADANGGGEVQGAAAPAQPAVAAAPNAASAPVSVPPAAQAGQKAVDHKMADAGDGANDDDAKEDSGSDTEDDEDPNIIKQIKSTHYTRVLILQRHLSGAWDPIVKELMSIPCTSACGLVPRPMQVFDAATAIRATYPCDPLLGLQELSRNQTLLGLYCKHMRATMDAKLAARKSTICKLLEEKWTK